MIAIAGTGVSNWEQKTTRADRFFVGSPLHDHVGGRREQLAISVDVVEEFKPCRRLGRVRPHAAD
ncbi:MAG: hypothetical protein O2955_06940 [Planctomycetota bacterium]|nr:hypothetical protein [Planctomycetota bacterium]